MVTYYDSVPYGSDSVSFPQEDLCDCVYNNTCPGCSTPFNKSKNFRRNFRSLNSEPGNYSCGTCGMKVKGGRIVRETSIPPIPNWGMEPDYDFDWVKTEREQLEEFGPPSVYEKNKDLYEKGIEDATLWFTEGKYDGLGE
jgi:hypothetical protein